MCLCVVQTCMPLHEIVNVDDATVTADRALNETKCENASKLVLQCK